MRRAILFLALCAVVGGATGGLSVLAFLHFRSPVQQSLVAQAATAATTPREGDGPPVGAPPGVPPLKISAASPEAVYIIYMTSRLTELKESTDRFSALISEPSPSNDPNWSTNLSTEFAQWSTDAQGIRKLVVPDGYEAWNESYRQALTLLAHVSDGILAGAASHVGSFVLQARQDFDQAVKLINQLVTLFDQRAQDLGL